MQNLKQVTLARTVAAAALFLPVFGTALAADTPYTSTGWVTGVPVLPIACTNADNQVLLRANAHTLRVTSSDPRLTGRRTVFANGAYQPDGSALIYGTAYQEVGAFDPANNFTPTAGLWEISYRGVMQTNYSLQLTFEGCGIGGSIDGLRIQETMTRAVASGPIDPAIPYLYTGTIGLQPDDPGVVLDNFDTLPLQGWTAVGPGQEALLPAGGQLIVRGYWPGVATTRIEDTYAWGQLNKTWSLAQQQTIEWRVDLVGMNEQADMAGLANGNTTANTCYLFYKWRDFVGIGKWVGNRVALLAFESAAVKNTNVVLVFALTRADPNVVLTGRLLDKDNPDTVLHRISVVDSPAADSTLTTEQVAALSGMWLTIGPDLNGVPYKSGNVLYLQSWQYNNGTRPAAEVTYDNLEQRVLVGTAEIEPVIGIEQAVRLTWMATYGVTYAVECAPTPQGPWSLLSLPIADGEIPGMKQVAVPHKQAMQFYRLVQAP